MELDPKALALFTEGYSKILDGLATLGYDTQDDNFADLARGYGRAAAQARQN